MTNIMSPPCALSIELAKGSAAWLWSLAKRALVAPFDGFANATAVSKRSSVGALYKAARRVAADAFSEKASWGAPTTDIDLSITHGAARGLGANIQSIVSTATTAVAGLRCAHAGARASWHLSWTWGRSLLRSTLSIASTTTAITPAVLVPIVSHRSDPQTAAGRQSQSSSTIAANAPRSFYPFPLTQRSLVFASTPWLPLYLDAQ